MNPVSSSDSDRRHDALHGSELGSALSRVWAVAAGTAGLWIRQISISPATLMPAASMTVYGSTCLL